MRRRSSLEMVDSSEENHEKGFMKNVNTVETDPPKSLPPSPPLPFHSYMLSSLHRLLTRCQPSFSSSPPRCSIPSPRSTHSCDPISLKRLKAREKAKRSSSPEKRLLLFIIFMLMPRSSIICRMTSSTPSCSAAASRDPFRRPPSNASSTSEGDMNNWKIGTAVVRTSLACEDKMRGA